MSIISQWLGSTPPLSDWMDYDRAYDTARLIAEKSVSLTVIREGVEQAAQTVRLELLSSGMVSNVFDHEGFNLTVGAMAILIVGYKSHPDYTDTDLRRADRFVYTDQMYEVQLVINNVPDRLYAVADVTE